MFERTDFPLNEPACTERDVSDVLHEILDGAINCQNRVMQILEAKDVKAQCFSA